MGIYDYYQRLLKWQKNYRHMRREAPERKKVLDYLETANLDDVESLKFFFTNHCFDLFPYSWNNENVYSDNDILFDSQYGLYYVYWNEKKLYWKRGVKKRIIKQNLNGLKLEQHDGSPHRYNIDNNDYSYVADLGTAEGCFTLDIIDRVKHAFLFECDPEWFEPLEATFAPWKHKVTLIKKFVGRFSDETHITLDEYFEHIPVDFIKADIEGAETDMLIGGEKTLKGKVTGANICLYHRPTDMQDILALLETYGYECTVNPGYMFMPQDDTEPATWFRRGLVSAKRVNQVYDNGNRRTLCV